MGLGPWRFTFWVLDDLDRVIAHQAAHAPVPNVHSHFLQLFTHAWTPITLEAQAVLITNISQDHHIVASTLAHWANLTSAKPAQCHPHNFAHKLNRPDFFPGVDEDEHHRLRPEKPMVVESPTASTPNSSG